MHQTVGNILRTLLYTQPPNNEQQIADRVDDALSTTMHALRATSTRSLGASPGALAFHRDMLLDIPLVADWLLIQQKRQVLIDENLRRQNMKRRSFDYVVGGRVLVKRTTPSKLGLRYYGPFVITQVHTNGTITIRRKPTVFERINIRRVVPYKET